MQARHVFRHRAAELLSTLPLTLATIFLSSLIMRIAYDSNCLSAVDGNDANHAAAAPFHVDRWHESHKDDLEIEVR